MKVVFISNYFNHHQQPFSDAMYQLLGDDFCFIETQPITRERLDMGWGMDTHPPYVAPYSDQADTAVLRSRAVEEADVVIIGSAPYSLVKQRIRNKKPTFCYSERWLKEKLSLLHCISHRLRRRIRYPVGAPVYMLCASAYTAADCARFGVFRNKCYKWGYFPAVKQYSDPEKLIIAKSSSSILWAGRYLDCKHPEAAIYVAKRLKEDGYRYTLTMIGDGDQKAAIEQSATELGLSDHVRFFSFMKPEEVRTYMEESEIFLFTSDRREGWGAVLNESMNSGCAVIASHAIGSAPFMVSDGNNGLLFQSGNWEQLYQKVKQLLNDPAKRKEMGRNAYLTVTEQWNAETAAQRFVALSERLLLEKCAHFPFEEGVCSKAGVLEDDWYKD